MTHRHRIAGRIKITGFRTVSALSMAVEKKKAHPASGGEAIPIDKNISKRPTSGASDSMPPARRITGDLNGSMSGDSFLKKVEEYRERADECRLRARSIPDGEFSATFLELADAWETLADYRMRLLERQRQAEAMSDAPSLD